jgi:hypothetical protein
MVNESVRRFLDRHAKAPREAVLDDAAPYVDMSPEERGRHLDAACRLAAEALLASPWRDRAREYREPPDPVWVALVRRRA